MKSEDVELILCAISFQDFQPMWSWSTNVTDRRTEGQTTCDRKTVLCIIVHRAVKTSYRSVTVAIVRLAIEHRSFNCIRQMALLCTLVWFIGPTRVCRGDGTRTDSEPNSNPVLWPFW